jgi:hypothetical protein
MATTYKVLAQSNPAATTETTLYTVPSSTSTVVSTVSVCNQNGSTAQTYRIAVRPAADGSTAAKHWIVYGATVAASDSIMLTLGLTLAAGDLIRIYASSADLSFAAFGSEIS